MEIFVVVLPGLDRSSPSADALIAAFERRLRQSRLHACSSCAGDYEDPDCRAWIDEDPDADEGIEPPLEDELSAPHQ